MRHTVPKLLLTPDVHTNIEFGIWNLEFCAKMAPNFVKSQSTAEASKMYREGHAMAPEPYTKATQTWEFSLSCVPANATQRCIAL